jgi:lysophospholipase L1-like esterase
MRRTIRTAVTVGLLAAPVLLGAAACATAPTTEAVGLGDSYAAGPLITPQDPSSPGCLRSLVDYPHRVALQKGYVLHDVSCSGATTDDMFASQTGYDGKAVPPQLNALSSTTDVVTLTIGGNDIGFTGIIENCIAYTPTGPTRSGQKTCKAFYTAGGTDQLAARIAATRPKVDKVLQEIKRRSPSASTSVAGYPAILPEAGACYPQLPLTPTDVGYLRGVEQQLNAMLKASAAANGARYADTYTPTIGHDACKVPVVRFVEPLVPVGDAAPVHPNRAGEAEMAKAVAKTTP